MSIQTEIDRISGNVSAALSAIVEKGVTVPDGSTSDALAELIASIEAGGGSGGTQLAYGTFTPAADTYDYVVTHNLGVMPDLIVVWSSDASTPSTSKGVLAIGTLARIGSNAQWFLRYRSSYYNYFAKTGDISQGRSSHPFGVVNETSFVVFTSGLGNYASAGVEYAYVAIKGITSW